MLIGTTLTLCPLAASQNIDPPRAAEEESCDGGTYQVGECLSALTEKWDKRLNAAYQEALKAALARQREKLRAPQRLWVQFRNANCDYCAFGEGSIARVEVADCTDRMTADCVRAFEGEPK